MPCCHSLEGGRESCVLHGLPQPHVCGGYPAYIVRALTQPALQVLQQQYTHRVSPLMLGKGWLFECEHVFRLHIFGSPTRIQSLAR